VPAPTERHPAEPKESEVLAFSPWNAIWLVVVTVLLVGVLVKVALRDDAMALRRTGREVAARDSLDDEVGEVADGDATSEREWAVGLHRRLTDGEFDTLKSKILA
jgi:hypothetical protein